MAILPICRCGNYSDNTVPIKEEDDQPALLQRIKHEGSVLSLAISDEYIFAGTQRNKILVWALWGSTWLIEGLGYSYL